MKPVEPDTVLPRPIFIGGLMKSGTTLLRALVGNHPAIFGGLETHWFGAAFAREFGDRGSGTASRLVEFYDVSQDVYQQLAGRSHTAEEFVDELLSHCARRESATRWVEKSPDNIRHTAAIWARWPDATVLHVIRDVRDVYASWKKNDKYDIETFIEHVQTIEERLAARLGSEDGHYLEVSYREFVTEPRQTMKRVIGALGEDWVDGLEQNQKDLDEFTKVARATGKESATLRSLARPVFLDSLGQYKSILDDGEIATLEAELASYIEKTGCMSDN